MISDSWLLAWIGFAMFWFSTVGALGFSLQDVGIGCAMMVDF